VSLNRSPEIHIHVAASIEAHDSSQITGIETLREFERHRAQCSYILRVFRTPGLAVRPHFIQQAFDLLPVGLVMRGDHLNELTNRYEASSPHGCRAPPVISG